MIFELFTFYECLTLEALQHHFGTLKKVGGFVLQDNFLLAVFDATGFFSFFTFVDVFGVKFVGHGITTGAVDLSVLLNAF